MTIEQFLEKQPLASDTKLRFQFTDQQGINWSCEASASRLKGWHILKFSCDLKCKEKNLFTFSLDVNKTPEDLFTTFLEIYEQSAKKSDKENITVKDYLQEFKKEYGEESQLKVFFRQRIFTKDSNRRGDSYRFTTENAVSLEEAVNGWFSHLFVDHVETRDDTVFVDLVTTAEKRIEEMNMIIQQEEQQKAQQKAQQEDADKRLNNAYNIFLGIDIVVGMIIGAWLGCHFSAGGGLLGLMGGLVGGLFLCFIVEIILEATGKIVYEDGQLKFKRK